MNVECLDFEGMPYVKVYPENYKKGEKHPLLLFLHGSGSRGDDLEKIKGHPFFDGVAKHSQYPFITVMPQCSLNRTWFDRISLLEKFVCALAQEEEVDTKQIYLMGASMGGYGTWQLAMSIPEMFAAIVPICGGGMYWNAARLVNVPVWAFHGEIDKSVFVEESQKMVDAVNKKGGNAKLTIYPETGHNSWTPTFENEEVFKWLLDNINTNDITIADEYNDGKIYG